MLVKYNIGLVKEIQSLYNKLQRSGGKYRIMKQSVKYLKILCNFIGALIVVFILFYVLPKVIVYFMPFVVGFLISLIASPVVEFLEKQIKIKPKHGTVLIIVLVIAGIVLLCNGAISLLGRGLKSFSEYLPTMYKNAETELSMQ